MSVWHHTPLAPSHLAGAQGDLVSVAVFTNPRALEDLLECLATLSFPINPQILHGIPTTVEFPAWEDNLTEIWEALVASGFDGDCVQVRDMLDAITAH